jgi:mRNA degradation ribonuclease J1/J2
MSDFGWQRRGFLSLVGLDNPASADGITRPVQLAEAAIDPRTGGAVAVTTNATLDGKDGVTRIRTYYWRMLPSGEQLSEKLFDIEFEPAESTGLAADGHTVKTPTLIPRSVWVLGRKLYDAADDGDLVNDGDLAHEDHRQSTAHGVMHNLSRVMMAVGEVNRQIRDGKLPEVAKIVEECALHDAIGERLVITGQSPRGGFDFDAADASGAKVNGTLTVPSAVALALMGFGVNTLDEHQRLRPEIQMQAADPKTGTVFTTEARISEGDNPKVSTAIAPTSLFGSKPANAIPRLTNVAWKTDSAGRSTLEELNLLGEDLTGEDQLTRMRALGTTNRILHDLRNRKYPSSMDHLVEYDLYDLVYQFEPPPPLSEGGRLTMISVGGNNMEEIAEGFGEAIGGNSKVVYHEGLDKDGKVDRVGVIVDLGLHLSPKDEANISAAPDVVEHLKHCKDILITHRHLDHTDGLFAYIQYGYLKGKVVHATPEVIRALRDKLRTYPSIHQDDLPTFSPLKGEGWLHIKDKEGKARISVDYARNATPHSARCTPFCMHGHYDGKWIGSYLNHGDSRYGRHNSEDYSGPPVDTDHLNKEFFTGSNRRLLAEIPDIDPKIADRGPTYFDMDITSILRQGWAPTEGEVEENLVEVSNWFKEKGMLLAMISTNDNRFETALRVATRADRDLTEFGTNLEKTTTTANVLGVNDLRHEPGPRNNIQLYLDQYFEECVQKEIDTLEARKETARGREKAEIEGRIEVEKERLKTFQKLKAMPHKFARYQARDVMEAELQDRFDEKVTLGSVRVGRTSKTSRWIMNRPDHDWRRLVLLTGTQGTNVEVDAALSALSEGRSLMDGNPSSSHTARPVDPKNNVVAISQTAIPGNDQKQAEMVRKLTSRGFTVVQALHDGFQIHNIDEGRRKEITKSLKKLGKSFKVEEDGSLVVTGMPIHAGGHGHQNDCNAWINMVKADVTAAQHTSDPQGGQRLAELCTASGQRYMDRVVPNFEGLSIKAGDSKESTDIHSVGRTVASVIRIHTIRQQRKYYGGHMEARRLVRQDAEGGFRSDGLRATARADGVYETAFATVDAEQTVKALAARTPTRPEPVPENRMLPPPERLDRGPILPGHEHRHRLFSQSQRQSAAFART